MADAFVARGTADRCLSMLAEYRAAGIDLPVVFPMPVAGDWGYERVIAALGAQASALTTEEAVMSEELVVGFFAALEAGDIERAARDLRAGRADLAQR